MSNGDVSQSNSKGSSVVGGKRKRFTLAIIFLVLAVISGILAIAWPHTHLMALWRILGFTFGLLFFLFLVAGYVGRASD